MDEENSTKQSDSFEIKKSTLITVIAVIAVFIVGFYLGGVFTGGNVVNTGTTNNPTGGDGGDTSPDTYVLEEALLVSQDDDSVLGDANAPISIIEFSDFECPFCGRFYSDTGKLLKQNYVDTGKANFVHRDFPLSFHADAQKAAEGAECAGEQDKYWEMHDLLYENQEDLSIDKIKEHAETIGLDVTLFNTCLDSGEQAAEVAADMADGGSYGVSGTPATFIVVNKELTAEKLVQLDGIAADIAQQAGRPLMLIFKGSGTTTVSVSGALPYDLFNSILSTME